MSEFSKTWAESFKSYAVDIAKIYKNNPEHITECLKFDSVCGSLNETYMSFLNEKQIEPIENLNQDEKLRLWNRAKELSDSKEKCIKISRSIYLLELLTK